MKIQANNTACKDLILKKTSGIFLVTDICIYFELEMRVCPPLTAFLGGYWLRNRGCKDGGLSCTSL